MGLRRRGARKNGETLGHFRLGCWLFNGRVSAALRWVCEGACRRHRRAQVPRTATASGGEFAAGWIVGRSVGG